MAQAETLQPTQTYQPRQANLRVSHSEERKHLTEDEQNDLAIDLFSVWQTAFTARADLNQHLAAWSALYEMEVSEQDWPWVGSANLVLPIVPAELDAMKSYIAAQVFVQRLIIVTAADDDPETAKLAPKVEQYYNAEIRRIRRDGRTPLDQFKTLLHLSLRDGGGPCDVLFTERKAPKIIVTEEPKIDDTSGQVAIDPDTGGPATERVVSRITETVREVNIIPRLLKEWYLVPDESTSIQSALGVLTTHWMTEKDLWAKVKEADERGGEFYPEAVERVLAWVTEGITDVSSAPDGAYDKTAGGQISVGQGQGAVVSKFFKNRGPADVKRLYSDQFDMDGDGVAEKNIFWFYSRQPLLLGWEPYEYVDDNWPTFCFSPFPRPDRPYGYSLVERLADITADACAGRNQRRNYIDLCLMPLLLTREGDTVRDKDRSFYPGADWKVEDPERSLKWFTPPPLSPDSFSDEARLDTYVAKLSGQNAPAVGAQSSGRRTATESRQQMAAQTVRAADVAMDFRSFLRAIMQFWHKLNKQYLGADAQGLSTYVPGDVAKATDPTAKGGPMTLPPEVLSRNFNIDIAGLSDPTDAQSRRTEIMAAMGVAQKTFPQYFQDPVKAWNWASWFMDSFQVPAIERFIGTEDEATQDKQAMQAQAQAQAAMQQQQMLQGGGPPQQGGPPQNGQPQPQGAQ